MCQRTTVNSAGKRYYGNNMMLINFLLILSIVVIIGAFILLILFLLYDYHKWAKHTTEHLSGSKSTNEAEDVFDLNVIESLHDIEIKYNGVISNDNQQI